MTAHGSPERVPLDALLRHRDWVRALARRLVLDENDADDVEQETWRMAVERPPRHAASVRGWLRTVVTNAARLSGRRSSRRTRHESAAVTRGGTPSPEDLVAAAEMQTRLARAVLDLDEPYRTTILYRFHEGLEATEIAARLGVPVETVRTRVKRGIERLRERMDEELGDDRDAWGLLLFGVRPPAAPVATGAAALGGGLAMAAATKLTAAAVVLVAAGAAWWLTRTDDAARVAAAAPPPPSPAVEVAPSPPPPPSAPPVRVHADASAETAAVPVAPPRLGGRVVDADGNAAANVRVVFLAEKPDGGRSPDLASSTSDETRTDAAGAFAAEPLKTPGVASAVALRYDGACGVATEIRPGEPVTITLAAGASLIGRVTDAAGAPVAGALVRVGCIVDAGTLVLSARSADDGAYRVAGIHAAGRAGIPAHVEFTADGFAPLAVPPTASTRFAPGEERRYDARLLRGSTLTGVVVEADSGTPLGGASLELLSEEGVMGFALTRGRSVGNPLAPRILGTATSAADGTFRFAHVPVPSPESLSSQRLGVVLASKSGYGATQADVRPAADGETVEVRVLLRSTATISGRVLDAAGKPVAGLKIWARIGDELNQASAQTDADGRYRLERFPAPTAGAVAVVHAFKSYDDKDLAAAEACRADVTVRAGADAAAPDMVWSVPKWPVVKYVVVDEKGAPVRGAAFESRGDAIASLRADDSGRAEQVQRPFPADWPRPWPAYRRVVRAPGFAPAGVATPAEPPDGMEIRVVLKKGRTISGRVYSSDGTPRAKTAVRVMSPGVPPEQVFEFDRRTSLDSLAERWPDVPFLGYGVTGEDGTFSIADLPDGPFVVAAWTRVPGLWTVVTDVRGGATNLELRLPDPEAALLSLGARVVVNAKDETGAPVPCTAYATGQAGSAASFGMPDEFKQGRTAFAPLRPGTWRLRIDAPGYVPWTKDGVVVELGRAVDPIEAVLRRGATVTVKLTLPDGVKLGGRKALLVSETGETVELPFGVSGSMRGSGATAGRWRVVVVAAGFVPDLGASFAAADGAFVDVTSESGEFRGEARCVPAGAVRFELKDRRLPISGNPCDDAKWRFGQGSAAEILDASGARVFVRRGLFRSGDGCVLLPGKYMLRVTYAEGDPVERTFEVVAGKTTALTIEAAR